MTNVWLDANVVIRFITKDSTELSRRARILMRRAQEGELRLRVSSVALAEIVWVLGSVYKYERGRIAEAMRDLAMADGVALDEPDVVLEALRLMSDSNVAYVDAYVAAVARAHGEAVATFDTDFKRLGVELVW